jgi:NTE family protein
MVHLDEIKTVGLALQGGGSHTAFSWGALDRLLDEVAAGKLRISAISGTSGGAINGAVCTYGLITGAHEAKRLLKDLWDGIAAQSLWPPDPARMLLPKGSPARWNVDWTPTAIGVGIAEQFYSPYYDVFFTNPLDELIRRLIPDFGRLNRGGDGAPKLFVCATEVNHTARRIFKQPEITPDTLLASSCYPTLFQAIDVDRSFYWDGGYMGNPALNPLVDCAEDLLTISINPLNRAGGPPRSPKEIINRINEISFNSSWVQEMRQILLINQLLEKKWLQGGPYRPKRFHIIRDDAFMEEIGVASKQNPSRDFIYELFDRGRMAADKWLVESFTKVGLSSSFDIDAEVALRLEGTAPATPRLRFKEDAETKPDVSASQDITTTR